VGYQVGQQFAPGGVTKAETIILYFYAWINFNHIW
jgi:hypothetical protein